MIPGFADDLNFEDVSFRDLGTKGEVSFMIYFTLNSFRYYLILSQKDGDRDIYPFSIFHETHGECCEFCGESLGNMDCRELDRYLDEIFEKLKQHPSIRLQWLFLK